MYRVYFQKKKIIKTITLNTVEKKLKLIVTKNINKKYFMDLSIEYIKQMQYKQ